MGKRTFTIGRHTKSPIRSVQKNRKVQWKISSLYDFLSRKDINWRSLFSKLAHSRQNVIKSEMRTARKKFPINFLVIPCYQFIIRLLILTVLREWCQNNV